MPGLPWGSLGWNCCSVPPAGGAGGKEGGPWWAEVTVGVADDGEEGPRAVLEAPGDMRGWHCGHACATARGQVNST